MTTDATRLLAEAPSEHQRSMLRRAVEVLPTCPGVRAVLVTGSLAAGTADRFSDVDLVVVVDDEDLPWWDVSWREAAEGVAGGAVLANPIGASVPRGYVVIGAGWEHLDLVVQPLSALGRPPGSAVLLDPDGLVPEDASPTTASRGEPYYPDDAVELFLYLLGVGTVTLGRGELVLAHAGIGALRSQLVAVMLGENGVRRSGGAKRLNPLLDEDQRSVLLTLSATAAPSLADVTRAYHALTVETVRRGRALAARCERPFPEGLLAATDAHLARELGGTWTGLGRLQDPGRPTSG